jgi:hypothetical protein
MAQSRLPYSAQIVPVLGTIVFINFSWTIGRMFFFLPMWLYFMTIWDLLPSVAYVLAFALFESLLILGVLLLLAYLLPGKFLRERFVPQGVLVVIIFTIATLLLHKLSYLTYEWSPRQVAINSLLILAAVVLSALAISYSLIRPLPTFERFCTSVAERMTVFLYLYIPLGVLSFIVIFVRNIT